MHDGVDQQTTGSSEFKMDQSSLAVESAQIRCKGSFEITKWVGADGISVSHPRIGHPHPRQHTPSVLLLERGAGGGPECLGSIKVLRSWRRVSMLSREAIAAGGVGPCSRGQYCQTFEKA